MVLFTGNASRLAATTILLTVLALTTYGLRVYCRVSRRAWGAEDWMMTTALVSSPEPRKRRLEPRIPRLTHSTGPIRRSRRRLPWRLV